MKNTSMENVWESYTSSWAEINASERLRVFEQSLSPDCMYTDPMVQITGYDQLSGYMSELHKNVPGIKFVTIHFANHHDRSLAQWNMVDGKGNVLTRGASYGLYGQDGRLTQMTGFFDLTNVG